MMYYVVIDTNVLVSALMYRESVPGIIVDHALVGKIIPLLNQGITAEYNDVLFRPKFKFDKRAVNILLSGLTARAINIEDIKTEEYFSDPKDSVFYNVVMEARKDSDAFLVTGNLKHFPLRPYIVTPREMLSILEP